MLGRLQPFPKTKSDTVNLFSPHFLFLWILMYEILYMGGGKPSFAH